MEPVVELNLCFKCAKEDEFHVSDLVWGKVKSYPWWPGQIVEPSAASAKAKKEKDSYLIAYFGDDSVLWSEAAKIKLFERHFSQMSKEGCGEAFSQAIDAALEEYSRRIQVGLACSCPPEDALGKAKAQSLTNSGLPAHLSGRGSFATAFQPEEIVTYLQTLAKSPQAGYDALKFVTIKAHLSSFYRRKGYNELPCLEYFDLGEDSDLGDDTGLHASLQEDDVDQVIYKKRKSPSTDLDQPEPLGENLLEQEEPAYSVPVRRGRGHPGKAVVEKAEPLGKAKKLDFISGSSSKFQNGQKEAASFVENADPLGETVEESEGAESVSVYAEETVQPVRIVGESESRVLSLTSQKYQENPPASEWLSKSCAAEVINKEACLEEMKKELAEHRSRERLLQKKESELIDRENTLEMKEKSMEPFQVLLDQKMKAAVLKEQYIQAQLEERETFFLKREAELIKERKAMEDREKSIESREHWVERRENEVSKQMDLNAEENGLKEDLDLKQENFEKWEHRLNAKEYILISREFELRDAEKAVKREKKKLEAYAEKLGLEFNCNDENNSRKGKKKQRKG